MKTNFVTSAFALFICLIISVLPFNTACNSAKKSQKAKSHTTTRRTAPSTGSGTATSPSNTSSPTPNATTTPLPTESNSMIRFVKSNQLMPVLETAVQQNKPVFVEFYASWCAPCKTLEAEVFNTPEVSSFVNDNFIALKVNMDSEDGKGIAQIYDVEKLPTMLFLDKKGNELNRIIGTTTPGRFIRAGAEAIGK